MRALLLALLITGCSGTQSTSQEVMGMYCLGACAMIESEANSSTEQVGKDDELGE